MKKILTLILILIISIINCNAEITNSIWNLTLGKSSKQLVLQELSKRGYNPEISKDNIEIKGDISFGGIKWENAAFIFENDILSIISFATEEIIVIPQ